MCIRDSQLTISNIASTIPPPFANRLEVDPLDNKSISIDKSQDKMPILPRVDEWEPYDGPPLSAADLESGRDPAALENARMAQNSLEVVEPGLVLPADTTTPSIGEKLEPFVEPINPPVAARSQEAKSFAENTAASANTSANGNVFAGNVATSVTSNEQTPQYPNLSLIHI